MTEQQKSVEKLALREEPVELYKILKFSGQASSGAEAKIRIEQGDVSVNGETELRKRRKMLAGDCIVIGDTKLMLILEDAAQT